MTEESSIPIVELVYDRDCPNVADCRAALIVALETMGLPTVWKEWERGSPDIPGEYLGFGSPTVLVDARDVHTGARNGESAGSSCRIYADAASGELTGFPSVSSIERALTAALAAAARGP